MNRLTTKQLIYINESLARLVGLESAVADPPLLEYIASAPYELKKGNDFYIYKNVADKAALLAILFSENRPFECLNIKTGVVAAITMLELNGIRLDYTQEELSELVEALTVKALTFEELRLWIFQHIDSQTAYKMPFLPNEEDN